MPKEIDEAGWERLRKARDLQKAADEAEFAAMKRYQDSRDPKDLAAWTLANEEQIRREEERHAVMREYLEDVGLTDAS